MRYLLPEEGCEYKIKHFIESSQGVIPESVLEQKCKQYYHCLPYIIINKELMTECGLNGEQAHFVSGEHVFHSKYFLFKKLESLYEDKQRVRFWDKVSRSVSQDPNFEYGRIGSSDLPIDSELSEVGFSIYPRRSWGTPKENRIETGNYQIFVIYDQIPEEEFEPLVAYHEFKELDTIQRLHIDGSSILEIRKDFAHIKATGEEVMLGRELLDDLQFERFVNWRFRNGIENNEDYLLSMLPEETVLNRNYCTVINICK
ncbi:hypothetical protein K9M79_03890 [Candidatus Woesearchaeota archaeon]|nr:hypothetical protein [Candidatus Woesearchaeota archaeon]